MFVQFKWLLKGDNQVLNADVTKASLFLLEEQLRHLTKRDLQPHSVQLRAGFLARLLVPWSPGTTETL